MENRNYRYEKYTKYINNTTALPAVFLAAVLVCAVFTVYEIPLLSVWNLAGVLICMGTFWFCDKVKKHRLEGTIAMIIFVVVVFVTFLKLAMGSDYGITFGRWFFSGADVIETQWNFLLALLVGFSAFFALTLYYFTQIRYRMSILTLVSLIPCVLYVKVTAELNNVFLILMALCNVIIALLKSYEQQKAAVKRMGRQSALVSSAVFVFLLLFLASAIPKKEKAPYYEIFENLFMEGNVMLELDGDFSDLNDFSGNTDNGAEFENRRMYMLYGEDTAYLKRQTFDYYDFKYDRWYGEEKYSEIDFYPKYYKEHQEYLSLAKLQETIREAEELSPGFAETYGLGKLINGNQIADKVCQLSVQSQNFAAQYYLAPARCITIEPDEPAEEMGITRGGVFRNEHAKHSVYASYDVIFYDEYESRNQWFALGGADCDNQTAAQMLWELYLITKEAGSENESVAWEFYCQQADADTYRLMCEENNDSISGKIRKLAQKITKDCTYDWEKADALQEYFFYQDFTYDMDYTAPDTSPEYFLFEGKTGTCSDFASAYVLMARSVGLTVRYAEGYVPEASLRSDTYTIADRNSHAYPEVFIQNMGWVVFEPTMPSHYRISADGEDKSFWLDLSFLGELDMDYKLMAVIAATAFLALCVVWLLTVVVPFVSERIFMIRVQHADSKRCVMIVYERLQSKILKKSIPKVRCMTTYEVAQWLENRMECQIYPWVFVVEKTLYGCYIPTDAEKRMTAETYVKIKKAVRKARKKKKLHVSFIRRFL